jgi:hypothetical protein
MYARLTEVSLSFCCGYKTGAAPDTLLEGTGVPQPDVAALGSRSGRGKRKWDPAFDYGDRSEGKVCESRESRNSPKRVTGYHSTSD